MSSKKEINEMAQVEWVLDWLGADIETNSGTVKPMDPELINRARDLTAGMVIDLDEPLP